MDKFQTLHEKGNLGVDIYPNILPANIPSNAIDTSKLADSAITTAKIADSAVTTAKIADGAITHSKLATASVDTSNLVDGAVSTAKIADGAITSVKISPHNIGSNELATYFTALIDYLVARGVVDFNSAMHEIARLLRDGLPLAFFISEDITKDIYKPVFIYVDQQTPEITFFANVVGSFSRLMSLGTDADWTQFVNDYRDTLYLKVIL